MTKFRAWSPAETDYFGVKSVDVLAEILEDFIAFFDDSFFVEEDAVALSFEINDLLGRHGEEYCKLEKM